MTTAVDEGVVFISNFHELSIEHCSREVSISYHFQPANHKVEPSHQKSPQAQREKQNASILEMVPVILVKPTGKGGVETLSDNKHSSLKGTKTL